MKANDNRQMSLTTKGNGHVVMTGGRNETGSRESTMMKGLQQPRGLSCRRCEAGSEGGSTAPWHELSTSPSGASRTEGGKR